MNRKHLEKTISYVRKVIPKEADLEELTNVWFYDNFIVGFNGLEWICCRFPIDDTTQFGTNAEKLEGLVKNLPEEELDISVEEDIDSVLIQSGDMTSRLQADLVSGYEEIAQAVPDYSGIQETNMDVHFLSRPLSRARDSTTLTGTNQDQRAWLFELDEKIGYILTNRVSIAMNLPGSLFFDCHIGKEEVEEIEKNLVEVPYNFIKTLNHIVKDSRPDHCSVVTLPEEGIEVRLGTDIYVGTFFPGNERIRGLGSALFDNLGWGNDLATIPDGLTKAVKRAKSISGTGGIHAKVHLHFDGSRLVIGTDPDIGGHEESMDLPGSPEKDGIVSGTVIADSLLKGLKWANKWCVQHRALLLTDGDTIHLLHFSKDS